MVGLYDLALSSLVFDELTAGYTLSFSRLVSATNGDVNLGDPVHRKAMLKWLNDWGCRHLAKEHHETTSTALLTWHQNGGASPFPQGRVLWELTDEEARAAASAYGYLKDMTAAWRRRGGSTYPVQMGPTAASKVLFALRPKALPPWDDAMRVALGCKTGSPQSYLAFLRDVLLMARKLSDQCERIGFGITDLPAQLGCRDATVVEIINKYLWMKHARKWTPPTASTVAEWAAWGSRQGTSLSL